MERRAATARLKALDAVSSLLLKDRKNDRALALVLGSFVDSVLEANIKARLRDTEHSADLFGERGPLGSFYWKIQIARMLGLITKDEARELDLIRKVRNHFAHKLHGGTFSEAPVRQLCAEFAVFRRNLPASKHGHPRERQAFFLTALLFGTVLELMVPRVRVVSATKRESINEMMNIVNAIDDSDPT